MTPVTLHVHSVQKTMGEEPIAIDFVTEGKRYRRGNVEYIVYDETELSGLEGHRTTLKIKADSVAMHRYGPMPTTMHFVVGRREETAYQTPYGELRLEYLTHTVTCDVSELGGDIKIGYALSIKGLKEATHDLHITFRNSN